MLGRKIRGPRQPKAGRAAAPRNQDVSSRPSVKHFICCTNWPAERKYFFLLSTRVYEFTKLNVMGLSGEVKEGETAKLWVDAASGLPVRMVIEVSFLTGGKKKSSFIFEDFQWNKPLPADLFKLEVPAGFKKE